MLNTARDESGTSAQVSLNERNAVKAMADAGSKGSFINISQVCVDVWVDGLMVDSLFHVVYLL